MFLAPPVLDLICLRALDLRLLCFCCHFVDRAKDLVYTVFLAALIFVVFVLRDSTL